MIEQRWVQIGGGAGVLGILVLAGSGFTTNNTLSSDSTTDQITNYLTSNKNGVLAQTLLTIVGSVLAMWFVATLAQLLRERDAHSPLGTIVLITGVSMGLVASLDGLPLTALVFVSKQGGLSDPTLVRAFYDLENGIIMPGFYGLVAAGFLIAFGLAAIRRVFSATWVGWLSLVFAALCLVSAVAGLTSTSGGTSAIGYFPLLSLLIFLIASIYMLRYRGAEVHASVESTPGGMAPTDRIAPSRG